MGQSMCPSIGRSVTCFVVSLVVSGDEGDLTVQHQDLHARVYACQGVLECERARV